MTLIDYQSISMALGLLCVLLVILWIVTVQKAGDKINGLESWKEWAQDTIYGSTWLIISNNTGQFWKAYTVNGKADVIDLLKAHPEIYGSISEVLIEVNGLGKHISHYHHPIEIIEEEKSTT